MGAGHGHGHPGTTHRWRLRVAFALVAAFFVVELAAGLRQRLARPAQRRRAHGRRRRRARRRPRRHAHRDASRPHRPAHLRLLPRRGLRVGARGAAHARGRGLHRRRGGRAHRWRAGGRDAAPMLVVGGIGLVVNVVALVPAARRGGGEPQRQGRLPRGRRRHRRLGRGHRRRAARGRHRVGACGTRPSPWRSRSSSRCGPCCSPARCSPCSASTRRPASTRPTPRRPWPRCADVVDVHDLHLWTLTSGHERRHRPPRLPRRRRPHAGAHRRRRVLRDRFAIDHATIQVEPSSAQACVETSW